MKLFSTAWPRIALAAIFALAAGLAGIAPARAESNYVGETGSFVANAPKSSVWAQGAQEFYVYMNQGDSLQWKFAFGTGGGKGTNGNNPVTITVTAPDNTKTNLTTLTPCVDADSDGDCDSGILQDQNTYAAAQTGTYNVSIPANTAGGNTDSDAFFWSLTPFTGQTAHYGRVWTNTYKAVQSTAGDIASSPADVTLYYVRADGYIYKTLYRQFNGIYSTFTSDAIGVVDSTKDKCVSAYSSFYVGDDDGAQSPTVANGNLQGETKLATDKGLGGNYSVVNANCLGRAKIFFAAPDQTLPAIDSSKTNASGWIVPKPDKTAVPSLSASYQWGSGADASGIITAHVENYIGRIGYDVSVDGQKQGDTQYVNAVLPDGASASSYDLPIPFDASKYAAGSQITVTVVADHAGEIHFINLDVEMRGGGIEVQRLNSISGTLDNASALFWNDSGLKPRCGTTLPANLAVDYTNANGGQGISSSGGIHAWNVDGCVRADGATGSNGDPGLGLLGDDNPDATAANYQKGASWGNARYIEDWTYDTTVKPVKASVTLAPQLTIAKTIDKTPLKIGEATTYHIAVRNTGNIPTSGNWTIVDTVPDNFTISDKTPEGCDAGSSVSGQTITCVVAGALTPMSDIPAELSIPVVANRAGSDIVNTASVFGGGDQNCVKQGDCSDVAVANIEENPAPANPAAPTPPPAKLVTPSAPGSGVGAGAWSPRAILPIVCLGVAAAWLVSRQLKPAARKK